MHETSPRRASGRHFRETSFKKGELRTDPARFKIGGNSYIKLDYRTPHREFYCMSPSRAFRAC